MPGVPSHLKHINAREEFQRLARAEKAAKLYCQGKTILQISIEMDCDRRTVARYLEDSRELWRKELIKSCEEIKAEQLAKVDRLEAEAWEGWFKSRKPELEIKVEKGDKAKSYKKVRYPNGDPRFLQVISHAIDQRMRILGVFDENRQGDNSQTQLLEVVVSTRAQAKKMLPYMDFAKEIDADEVTAMEPEDDATGDNLSRDSSVP
jgi:hypothetical protein